MSDQPLSGAQFARQVGADPEKWAAEFLKAAALNTSWTDADRLAFTTQWFRDAMEAAVKATKAEYDELMKTGTWKVSCRPGYGNYKPSE